VPIYEYQCQACQERLETIQSLSAPPLTTCPECGGELRKLLSAPAFHLKGSGWYVTDYARQGNGKKRGEGESGDSGKSESKGDSQSESKPDSKTGSAQESKPSSEGKAAKSAAS
jgi:putative FmdB family regulatory protein